MEIDLSILDGKVKYYYCDTCGNLFEAINDSRNVPVCCGKTMRLLIPGITDGAIEAHVPIIEIEHDKVTITIGSRPHPMTPEHHINWISLQTNQGVYRRIISPNEPATTCFLLREGEKVIAAFAYCNLHELWMAEPTV